MNAAETLAEAQLGTETGGGISDEGCRELLTRLEQHNFKEEAIVYPEADTALSAEADSELRAFLVAGQTPAGWVCEQAGV